MPGNKAWEKALQANVLWFVSRGSLKVSPGPRVGFSQGAGSRLCDARIKGVWLLMQPTDPSGKVRGIDNGMVQDQRGSV